MRINEITDGIFPPHPEAIKVAKNWLLHSIRQGDLAMGIRDLRDKEHLTKEQIVDIFDSAKPEIFNYLSRNKKHFTSTAMLLRDLQSANVNWPEIPEMLDDLVDILPTTLKDPSNMSELNMFIYNVSTLAPGVSRSQIQPAFDILNKHKEQIIRRFLSMIRRTAYSTVRSEVQHLQRAGVDWPELTTILKSLSAGASDEDQ